MSNVTELEQQIMEEIETQSVNPDAEPHIVINEDRTITVPEELRCIAVQDDHNVETVTFDCPRYWDEHDISTMRIFVNTRRPDGEANPTEVKNVRVDDADDTIIHFDWTISDFVTQVPGNLAFLVCAKEYDENSVSTVRWHTRLNSDLRVYEGLNATEEVIQRYPDIIEQILVDLENGTEGKSAYDIAVANGFKGSEAEWLESLEGTNGKSAYEYATDGGFVGTEQEFAVKLAKDYVEKQNAVVEDSLSMGRTPGSTVGEDSTALGSNVQAIGSHSAALGVNAVAGCKGYYIIGANQFSTGGTIFVSDLSERRKPVNDEDAANECTETSIGVSYVPTFLIGEAYTPPFGVGITVGYDVGDEFTIITGSGHYVNCGKITKISYNAINYEGSLPFDVFTEDKALHGNSIAVLKKPTVGNAVLTHTSFSFGSHGNQDFETQTAAAGRDAFVVGRNNVGAAYSRVSGAHNIAGYCASVDGMNNIGLGKLSHVEGSWNKALAYAAHVEGDQNEASGEFSHAEGRYTKALADYTHTEGFETTAGAIYAHAEGVRTRAMRAYSHTEGIDTCTYGDAAHAEGTGTAANAVAAHAEGKNTAANGEASHAEGISTVAKGTASHSEGNGTEATGASAHAEGHATKAIGAYSHAEGYYTEVSGLYSHTEGVRVKVLGAYSHGEGIDTQIASGCDFSHVEGNACKCNSIGTHVEGYGCVSNTSYQHVQGKFNLLTGHIHAVGWGSSDSNRANIHTIDTNGSAWYKGSVTSNGADYAEYFEWQDKNTNNEDRIGLLVTLDGDKIKLANQGDEILGIVSGTAAVLGDNYECEWNGKYLTDEFGRIQYELVEEFHDFVVGVDKESGEPITERKSLGFVKYPILNPEYDASQEYVNRASRPEWDTVGMLGKLHLRDNGTCNVNGYATVDKQGVAKAADTKTNMRVISRVNEHIVRVLLK